MTTYEYITTKITPAQFKEMVRAGIIPIQMATYLQIYEWHIKNGKSQRKTGEHFHMSQQSVGYAVRKMKNKI